MVRDREEGYQALQNLQGMLKKVFEENGMLLYQKETAENSLKEYLTSEAGHLNKALHEAREEIKGYRQKLHGMEDDNTKMLRKYKRHRTKATEAEMFLKQSYVEIESLREVTVQLQRQNLEM